MKVIYCSLAGLFMPVGLPCVCFIFVVGFRSVRRYVQPLRLKHQVTLLQPLVKCAARGSVAGLLGTLMTSEEFIR